MASADTSKGTPNEQSDIDASFTSGGTPAAILVTLSATASDNPFAAPIAPPDTLERSNRNVITAMKAHGVRKIVIMHAQGVGDSYPEASFLTRLLASKTQMRHQFKDHGNTDKLVRAEAHGGALRWTMVRPPMLKGMEKLPVKDMGDQSKGAGLIPSCSRGSAA